MSFVFKPVGILSGLAAGLAAKKIFELLWGLIDDQEPPQAKHRHVKLGRLAAALTLEGAIFSIARGFVDHGARWCFSVVAGEWPGEEGPEPELQGEDDG